MLESFAINYFFFFDVFIFVAGFFVALFFAGAFPFVDDVAFFAGALSFLFVAEDFPFAEGVFPFALPLGDGATYFSTVQFTLTETTSSPGFTSTTTSPLVAARLRTATVSRRV